MKTVSKVVLAITAMAALFLVSTRLANAITGPNINLPPSQVTVKVEYPSSACYYYVYLSNVPDGYHVSNGVFLGWCVDEHHYIYNGRTYSARLYSSYDANNPHPDPDWPKVNYILNNKQGSWEDVQAAIWYFVDGGTWPSDPDAQAMINAANANGENFVPGPGQTLAVIVWINSNTQVPIIEVVVPLQNVVPEYPLGPIFGVASFFAALGVYKRKLCKIDLF
ncbi:MAG: hypothetical protein QXQ94_06805 [Candidatus Bathyarchaeia archaeon]